MDICGELAYVPYYQRFLFVVYDLHSKWPEVVPMGSVTASAMVDFLEQLFSRWGIPRAITTDNRPQLVSSEFSSYLAARGIPNVHTAFYHPQANGGVEKCNRSLKNGIRAHLAQCFPFKDALSQTLMQYHATQHATTGVSPACLMLGRELELPLSRLHPPQQLPVNTSIRARVHQHQRNMRARYDSKYHVRPTKIRVQDWVRAHWPHRSNTLSSFLSDPLQIKRQLGPVTFELANGSRWHASCLCRVPTPSVMEENLRTPFCHH